MFNYWEASVRVRRSPSLSKRKAEADFTYLRASVAIRTVDQWGYRPFVTANVFIQVDIRFGSHEAYCCIDPCVQRDFAMGSPEQSKLRPFCGDLVLYRLTRRLLRDIPGSNVCVFAPESAVRRGLVRSRSLFEARSLIVDTKSRQRWLASSSRWARMGAVATTLVWVKI